LNEADRLPTLGDDATVVAVDLTAQPSHIFG